MYINHQFKNTAEKMKVRIIIFLLQRKIRLTIKVEWLGAHPWKYRMNAQKAEVMCYLTNHHPCIYFSKFSVLSSYLFPWSFYLSLSSIPTSFIVKVSVFECYKEWEVVVHLWKKIFPECHKKSGWNEKILKNLNLTFHFKTCKCLAKSYILTSTLLVDRWYFKQARKSNTCKVNWNLII